LVLGEWDWMTSRGPLNGIGIMLRLPTADKIDYRCHPIDIAVSVAILSDIHANLPALKAVLSNIESLKVNRIICAGDIVGYYPFPDQVVEALQRNGVESIIGNHDRAVIHVNTVGMNRLAAEAARWTSLNMAARHVDYLRLLRSRMRLRLGRLEVAVYHGTPRDDDEYLYEADLSPELLEMCSCDLMISGHTHIPYLRRYPGGMIMNPGSVGQPRDGDPRACFGILDDSGMASIHRVEYDIAAVERAVEETELPRFLGERLRYGF